MTAPLEITSHVLVRASPEQVWQAAVDWTRQGEWMWGTRVRGGHGVGAEVSAWTGFGPVGFTDTMVITEWDPPRRCVVRHTGRVVRGGGIFEAVPCGRQCEFRWTEQLELPAAAAPVARALVGPLGKWGLDASLRRFARLVGRSLGAGSRPVSEPARLGP